MKQIVTILIKLSENTDNLTRVLAVIWKEDRV